MENIFEKQGMQFKIITEYMIPSECDFMWENQFLGPRHWVSKELHLKDAMMDGSSITAIDNNGSIIGVRLGRRKNISKYV